MTFGAQVRRYRLAFGLSQAELARAMRYARPSSVAVIERDRGLPTPTTILRVAKALNIPTSYLLADVPDPYDRLRADEVHTVSGPLGPNRGLANAHFVTDSETEDAWRLIETTIRRLIEKRPPPHGVGSRPPRVAHRRQHRG